MYILSTAAEGGHGKSQLKSRKWLCHYRLARYHLQFTTYNVLLYDLPLTTYRFTTCDLPTYHFPFCDLLLATFHLRLVPPLPSLLLCIPGREGVGPTLCD